MDIELRILLLITRSLPPVRGAIRIGRIFRDFYLRKDRGAIEAKVHPVRHWLRRQALAGEGFKMRLYPNKSFSNSACLFFPQLYDYREVRFLNDNLKEGDIFLDLGAHIGYYSLIASRLVGQNGKVLAVEADPHTYRHLTDNLQLNDIKNIKRYNFGISDKKEDLELGIDKNQRGRSSFLGKSDKKIRVRCLTLNDIIQNAGLAGKKIKGLKIDIEGFEYKALKPFLENYAKENLPEFILLEYNSAAYGDKLHDILREKGYKIHQQNGKNYIFIK